MAGVALFAAVGCQDSVEWQAWPRESALGLSFAVPPGRRVERSETRVRLENPAAYRTADVIVLSLEPPADRTVGNGPVIEEGDAPASFRVRENPGGSGGQNYTLLTSKRVGVRTISLLAIIETEGGTPSFAETWAVWESLSED